MSTLLSIPRNFDKSFPNRSSRSSVYAWRWTNRRESQLCSCSSCPTSDACSRSRPSRDWSSRRCRRSSQPTFRTQAAAPSASRLSRSTTSCSPSRSTPTSSCTATGPVTIANPRAPSSQRTGTRAPWSKTEGTRPRRRGPTCWRDLSTRTKSPLSRPSRSRNWITIRGFSPAL